MVDFSLDVSLQISLLNIFNIDGLLTPDMNKFLDEAVKVIYKESNFSAACFTSGSAPDIDADCIIIFL